MRILLDTNVLCRLATLAHPLHPIAQGAISNLLNDGHELFLVPQNLYEYWVVATRPLTDNGLGIATVDADQAVDQWLDLFEFLPNERGIFEVWRELIRSHGVQGKKAHDARLVAAMKRYNVSRLLTFNTADFLRYPGIELLDPATVARN